MRLIQELGVEIGERVCGSPAAERATEAIAAAFHDLGLEPRFQEFEFVGYDTDEPELEIDGERWATGPCMYSAPTSPEGAEGRIRRIGTSVWAKDLFEVPIFAIEDESGREIGRLCGNPFDGGAIPFTVFGHIVGPPQVFISSADTKRLASMDGARARLKVNGRYVPGMRDRNVLAELPGESREAVSAVSILHFPYPEYHLPEETIELVDERRLDDAVELAVALTESQLARPVVKEKDD